MLNNKRKCVIHEIIDNTPSLAKIFAKGSVSPSFRRTKNVKEILARPRRTNHTDIKVALNEKGNAISVRVFLSRIRSFFPTLVQAENTLSDNTFIVNLKTLFT